MRAESAVEPTRSENITVTWRRSAASWGAADGACPDGGLRSIFLAAGEFGYRSQQLGIASSSSMQSLLYAPMGRPSLTPLPKRQRSLLRA